MKTRLFPILVLVAIFLGLFQVYGFGADTLAGNLTVQKQVFLLGSISDSLTANQNNYAPTGFVNAAVVRISTDASRNITGLAGGVTGRIISLVNTGAFNLVLKNQSASSTAANRFAFDADRTILPGGGIWIWYDVTASRWQALDAAPISSIPDPNLQSGAFAITTSDFLVAFTGSSNATFTVPSASANPGRPFRITNMGTASAILTVDATGSGNFFTGSSGITSFQLAVGESVDITSVNNTWKIQ